ncbi:Spermidine N(1)-acetyltransferase [Nocardia farcinica]|uniref:Spermidine N(1)-acetyltransferase n=1 Tax=Nocardia farcinica TaxID=37329 RepID=A0A449GG02_NOCFR|nr:GNAT family N-acetyltransferase [Nocardia farcinica]VFA91409.1 Spermidine N(1)-acetyltransferase [Nocardia farcinica]
MTPAGLTLVTPRLRMRPLRSADAERLHVHWNDPGVRRYLFDDEPVPTPLVLAIIERSERDFAVHGYGLWTLTARGTATGELLGVSGLRRIDHGIELVCSVADRHRGEGLAVEACRAVLKYAFGTLGLDRVIAEIDAGNRESVRLAERLDMVRTRAEADATGLVRFEATAPWTGRDEAAIRRT